MDLKDYDFKEKGQANALLGLVLIIIVIGVAAIIGVSIMASTYTTIAGTLDDFNASVPGAEGSIATDANAAAGGTFTTLNTTVTNTNTVVIALMGAIAIGAILSFLAFGRGRGRSGGTM